jgi:hypothetical protein
MSIVQVLFIYLVPNSSLTGPGTDSCVECMSIPMPSLVDVDNESAFAIASGIGLIHYDFAHTDPIATGVPAHDNARTLAVIPTGRGMSFAGSSMCFV